MKILASLVFLLTAWTGGANIPPAPGLETVFGPPRNLGSVETLDADQVTGLLKLSVQRQWNLFDLLDEATLFLKSQNRRVRIPGDLLRSSANTYRLGDHRVDTLLPLKELVSVTFGAKLGDKAEVEILLTTRVSGFLELGDFALETRYGFELVVDKTLDHAFGISVKNGWFTGNLVRVVRVPDPTGHDDPNFIALHIDNLFRPKRWQIDPVRWKPEPPPKP